MQPSWTLNSSFHWKNGCKSSALVFVHPFCIQFHTRANMGFLPVQDLIFMGVIGDDCKVSMSRINSPGLRTSEIVSGKGLSEFAFAFPDL